MKEPTMTRRIPRCLCLFLASLFLLSSLASCQPAESETQGESTSLDSAPQSGTESESASESESETTLPPPPSSLSSNPTTLFSGDMTGVIPSLFITVDGLGTMLTTRTFHAARVSATDTEGGRGDFESLAAEIRCRGNATFKMMPKKSFRLRFVDSLNLFGQDTGKARNWALLAEYCDRTMMRNRVAMTMADVLGIEHSSSSYVHLYFGNEYYGLFHVLEHSQIQSNRVDIEALPSAVVTEYLVELDYYAYEDGKEGVDYFTLTGKRYAIKNDNVTAAQCNYVKEIFSSTENILRRGTEEDVAEVIDVASFVDMYLLHLATKNTDIGHSSFYYVLDINGRISCTWPWDFDISMGNDERLDNGSYTGFYPGKNYGIDQQNRWFDTLMQKEWFVERVRVRWNEIGEDLFTAAITEIDALLEAYGDDFRLNFERWPCFGQKLNVESWEVQQLEDFDAHVEYLVEWLTGRYEYLDEYLSDPETAFSTVK